MISANLRYTLRLAMTVSMSGFIFGFDASVISGVVGFISAEYNLGVWEVGLVVSAPTLGGILSGFFAAPLSDRYGRKTILLYIACLYTVSAVFSAFAPNYETLIVARFLGGMAFASLALAPIYISEIAPPEKRGTLVSINQLNIVLGFSAAYFANYLLLKTSQSDASWVSALGVDTHTWRWMLGLEILPASVYLLLLLGVPESPRWLAMHQRFDEAKVVFARLMPAKDIDAHIAEIKMGAKEKPQAVFKRLKELFKPNLRLALIIGVVIAVVQQVTGINAIFFYAPTIFEQSGVGTDAAFAQAVYVGIINVIFTLVAMVLIDRIGRKPLLMIGLGGIFLSMFLCSYGFYTATYKLEQSSFVQLQQEAPELSSLEGIVGQSFANDVEFKRSINSALGNVDARKHESAIIAKSIHINPYVVLIGILGFVASFAMSLGPVMWVLLPEIFPTHLRGVAMAFTGVINSGASFFVQFCFPWQLNNMGAAYTFIIYSMLALISFVFVMMAMPETRGKSLEALEQELAGARA